MKQSATNTKPDQPLSTAAWQEEQVFCHANIYFNALIADIRRAESSIELETYIFSDDTLGRRIIDALVAAVKRGVGVRVLMDGAGSAESGHHTAQALEQQGVAVKIFHPLPWKTKHFKHALTQGPVLVKLFYFIRKINQRDHRKMCIIDQQRLWSGSLNISIKHLPVEHGGENWRDYGLKVTGPSAKAIAHHFDHLWNRRPVKIGQGFFKFYFNNFSDWARQHKNQLLIDKITNAKHRIWITSAYFAPSSRVIRALKYASRNAIDIRLIVPAHSDIHFFPFLTATYYADLLKTGVRVFEYTPGILHAKALLIDDFCLVGSTNFNHRSFLHDLELDIVLHTIDARASIESSFQVDMAGSEEITLKQLGRIKRYAIVGWIPRLLRYWL